MGPYREFPGGPILNSDPPPPAPEPPVLQQPVLENPLLENTKAKGEKHAKHPAGRRKRKR